MKILNRLMKRVDEHFIVKLGQLQKGVDLKLLLINKF